MNTGKQTQEERMRTQPLSQGTRDYLIVIGKIDDAMNELWRIVDRDYGGMQTSTVIDIAHEKSTELRNELYRLLSLSIDDRTGFAECKGL